ncbi:hypothetical protein OCK74_15420 [Chitinophagaceae bacterium LB-8]|uniref:Uncharacterized protein n=1 Tax=Paraflavisolibacter caeni TaxID=2982496 RepID=A0A9X3BI07_9BACT|nr:hypothetical protein [Paraflavisolibacter caeni]MCU7550507.1 hypothetical protein [Paraflavisolibacter caeni]
MKKAAAFILLLIIFISAFTPCRLLDDCADDQVAASHHHEEKKDCNCSPFFTCSSCLGFVCISKPVSLPALIPEITIHYEKKINIILSSYTSKLLHPPQAA